jgi:hypothetical protein
MFCRTLADQVVDSSELALSRLYDGETRRPRSDFILCKRFLCSRNYGGGRPLESDSASLSANNGDDHSENRSG